MSTLSEQEFRVRSDEAIEQARRALLPLADQEGFEVELRDGVLDVVFEEPSDGKVRHLTECSGTSDLGLGAVTQLQAHVVPGAERLRARR